ncbi:MAG: PhoH family protein, partial [Betaproteobacteria bacterium]|nr:PhoH family protein [Betaproteobacteria bacterium]
MPLPKPPTKLGSLLQAPAAGASDARAAEPEFETADAPEQATRSSRSPAGAVAGVTPARGRTAPRKGGAAPAQAPAALLSSPSPESPRAAKGPKARTGAPGAKP